MLVLKPFIRIIFLSSLLAALVIYLGIKYHWGDYFQKESASHVELTIPTQESSSVATNDVSEDKLEIFKPEIIQANDSNALLASMNLEQMTQACNTLLIQRIPDALTLELAIANCVVSNYQETYQNESEKLSGFSVDQKKLIQQKCANQYSQSTQYTSIEKQLLIGICVSDTLSK